MKYDAYLALKYSIQDNLSQEIINLADVDNDNHVTAYDAYIVLKISINT